jgi:hypothetical protein
MYDLENVLSSFLRGRFVTLCALLMIVFGITPYALAVNLPETGQTTCYFA